MAAAAKARAPVNMMKDTAALPLMAFAMIASQAFAWDSARRPNIDAGR